MSVGCSSTFLRPWARRWDWLDHWSLWCMASVMPHATCQTYSYLPSHRATPPVDLYQIILLGDEHKSRVQEQFIVNLMPDPLHKINFEILKGYFTVAYIAHVWIQAMFNTCLHVFPQLSSCANQHLVVKKKLCRWFVLCLGFSCIAHLLGFRVLGFSFCVRYCIVCFFCVYVFFWLLFDMIVQLIASRDSSVKWPVMCRVEYWAKLHSWLSGSS